MTGQAKGASVSAEPSQKLFDAFICYSRQDISFARRLEAALENFRPPKGMGIPERRLTVFRDERDLTGAEYYAAIERNLGQCKKLIVICTPASRDSTYANDEIRRFARLRGADGIIPVLLSGIPNNEIRSGEESQMAFPDALCEVMGMPLAASFLGFDPSRDKFHRARFENAWYTLLANILDTDRQTIEQRDYKRRLRQRNVTIGLTGAIAVTLAGLALVAWGQKKTADEQRQVAQKRLADNYWQRALEAREEGKRTEASHFLALHASIETDTTKRENSILGIQDYIRSTALEAMTDGYNEAELPENYHQTLPPAILSRDEKLLLSWHPGDGSFKGNGIARVWRVQDSSLATAPLRHEYWIYGARFDAKATRVLTWGGGFVEEGAAGEAVLWSIAQGKPVSAPMKHKATVRGAIFNKQEDKVLTWAEDGVAQLWDTRDGKPLCSPMKHEYPLSYARFVGDEEQVLTVDVLARCSLWKSTASTELRDMHKAKVFTPKPTTCAPHFAPVLWKGYEEEEAKLFLQDRFNRESPAFPVEGSIQEFLKANPESEGVIDSTGDRILTWGAQDRIARLLDAHSQRQVAELGHEEGLVDGNLVGEPIEETTYVGAVFSPSGKYIALLRQDKSFTLWHSRDGLTAFPQISHAGNVKGVVFSKDEKRVLSWDDRGMVILATLGHRITEFQILQHDGPVYAASFNHDETKILTVSGNGTARLWKVGDRFDRGLYLPHPAAVFGVLEDHKGKKLLTWSGSDDDPLTVRVWNAEDGSPLTAEMRHDKEPPAQTRFLGVPPGGAAFNRDFSRILTWGRDGTVRLWRADDGRPLLPVMAHDRPVLTAKFGPDETRIFSSSEDLTVRLWDSLTGKETVPPLKHQALVEDFVYSDDAQRILTWDFKAVRLWDTTTGKPLTPPLKHEGEIVGARFDPKQERILTWSKDKTARLWSAKDGRELTPPMKHDEPLQGAVFSNDGGKILTWTWFFSAWGRTAGAAQLWNAQDGSALTQPMLHKQGVHGAFFYARDTRVFTWSEDATARIWDTTNGNSIATLRHRQAIRGAELSRDRQRILTWSTDGTARLWSAADGTPLSLPITHSTEVSGVAEGDRWFLTWTKDDVYLWDHEDGSPIVQPFRYSTDKDTSALGRRGIHGAAFFGGGDQIGAWGEDALILWKLRADYDFPPEFFPLLVQAATGTILDQDGSIRFLTRDEWLIRRTEYLRVAEEHLASCAFQRRPAKISSK